MRNRKFLDLMPKTTFQKLSQLLALLLKPCESLFPVYDKRKRMAVLRAPQTPDSRILCLLLPIPRHGCSCQRAHFWYHTPISSLLTALRRSELFQGWQFEGEVSQICWVVLMIPVACRGASSANQLELKDGDCGTWSWDEFYQSTD